MALTRWKHSESKRENAMEETKDLNAPRRTDSEDDSSLEAVVKGAVSAAGGVVDVIFKLVYAVVVLIAGIWIYGAICAHNDIEKHQPLGVILQRMYGTEYNSLTRHGYRIYIKHFTTTKPEDEVTKEDLEQGLQGAFKETMEDLDVYLNGKENSSENREIYRLRENLADAVGNAARGKVGVSDGVIGSLDKSILEALSSAEQNDESKTGLPAGYDGMSSEDEDAEHLFSIGLRYYNGSGGRRDLSQAAKWFRKAAEQGSAVAQCRLGVMYDNGHGVAKDEAEAVRWYRKAAEQRNARAQFHLGNCYIAGRGVEQNNAEAVRWFRKGAEQGYASAQNSLGYCYAMGSGIAKDAKEAAIWFRKAAEQGNAHAQNSLGFSYLKGNGVAKNEAEAVKWFRKAAEQGYAKSQYQLGVCYENGTGIEKDIGKAKALYENAAKGYEPAKKALERLRADAEVPAVKCSFKSSRDVVDDILAMSDVRKGFDRVEKRFVETRTRGFNLNHKGSEVESLIERYDFPDNEHDDIETKRFKTVWKAYADGLARIAKYSASLHLESSNNADARNVTRRSLESSAQCTLDGVVTVTMAESVCDEEYEVTVVVAQSEKRKRAYHDYRLGQGRDVLGKYSLSDWIDVKSGSGIICPQSFVDNDGIWWRVAGVPVAGDRLSGSNSKGCIETARIFAEYAALRTISVDVMSKTKEISYGRADKEDVCKSIEREVKLMPLSSRPDASCVKWFEKKSTSPISGEVLLVVCAIREDTEMKSAIKP